MRSISKTRVLDFDIENRPLSYWCADRPSADITAIAWSWLGESRIHCLLLGEVEQDEMLTFFCDAYDQADMVTGHYIRKHDLPIVNGALIELGLDILGDKLTSDTKLDLVKRQDLPVSQEALSAYLGVKAPKIQMTQADWRSANRLTEEGLERTRRRCVGDIVQHKQMRSKLIERGLLKGPKIWTP